MNAAIRRVPAWTIYIVCAAAVIWLFWRGAGGALGPDPVKAIERQLGSWAIWGITAGLAVTPLRRWAGVNLIRHRRAIGVSTFFLVVMHFLTWIVLDMGLLLDQALADMVRRPFVTAGMVGLVAMIPLAVTSNNASVRRLGPVRWQKLHKLTYLAALAGAFHYLWLVKVWTFEPLFHAGAIGLLLAMRLIPKRFPLFARDSRVNRA